MYEIIVQPEPEIFNGKPMYFWVIMGVSGKNRYNCGHGWAKSVVKAAEDASKYYIENIKEIAI